MSLKQKVEGVARRARSLGFVTVIYDNAENKDHWISDYCRARGHRMLTPTEWEEFKISEEITSTFRLVTKTPEALERCIAHGAFVLTEDPQEPTEEL